MSTLRFLVNSDLHFTTKIRPVMDDNVSKILAEHSKTPIDALICPGDLTNMGWNGAHLLCWKYGGDEDQLGAFISQYLNPLDKEIKVYISHGNHDTYVPWPYFTHPVLKYVKKRHGDIRYTFDIKGIHFICVGLYPDKKGIEFLNANLDKNKKNIIFFHYNLQGPFSDWWTDVERDVFESTIKNYDIVCIIVGHQHVSRVSTWKNYPVISAAGSKIAKCEYDIATDKLDVDYI